MLVFWKKSSFLVSRNQVWVIVCKTLLANVGATGINIEQYIEKFVQKTEKLKVGDPRSEDTDLGPVVNASGLKKIDGNML
jgi:hypothetical protein